MNLPGTVGSNINTWDPAIAVAPNGTVYASFMLARNSQYYPVVDASFDHRGDVHPVVVADPAGSEELGRP